MKLILTQPQAQAESLAARIQALLPENITNLRIECLPLLRIDSLNVADEQQLQYLERTEVIICTSPSVAALLPKEIPSRVRSARWFCPGEGTAKALLDSHGIIAVHPHDQQTSEALLACASLETSKVDRVLLITGRGGRGLIESTLTMQGTQVERLELYCRNPIDITSNEIDDRSDSLWLISSAEALRQLHMLNNKGNILQLLVTSQRLARQARDNCYNYRLVASNKLEHILATLFAESINNGFNYGRQKKSR